MDFSTSHAFHDTPDEYAGFYANPNVNLPHPMSCDIKPRLTKEQHDILEAHYQKQSKPNTNTKKGFAESLNVSLDKVNNWFQNRRAKSKQDAKKQLGAYNLFAQQNGASLNFSSDSDLSPAFPSGDFYSMMHDQAPNDVNLGQMPHFQEQSVNALPYQGSASLGEQYSNGQHMSGDMFDSPLEMNRRTMTQEQYDMYTHDPSLMQSASQFDNLHNAFSGAADMSQQGFPHHTLQNGFKQQDAFSFHAPIGAPLSSSESSAPSTISEQSMYQSSNAMQDHATMSAASSDWADSRSSSVSVNVNGQGHGFQQIAAAVPQQHATTSSQWQPGQSVPVDPNALQQQFREAQRLALQQQQQQAQNEQQDQGEQPLAWPADEAFGRRDSQNGTMLAQQMSSFAIQTPLPQQTATFKSPLPPGEGTSSIAARRQRPRPAALGLASLRSQSYSGAVQPASPSQQAQSLAPNQQIRRIRSSNVMNGVAQGRVMKSTPGSAQRSPLSWTFADSLNSPKAARHASNSSMGNLAPPTPLSPNEMSSRSQFPPWQSSSGQFSRQASISETDAEYNTPSYAVNGNGSSHAVSSPPHTPLYHHHHHHHHHHHQQQPQFAHRAGNNFITENTPPQSAPAAQQTFPANLFLGQQQSTQASSQAQHHPQAFLPQQPQPQQFVSVSAPDQQYHMPAATYIPTQQFAVSAIEPQPQMSMQFANGVPVVDAQGNLTMAFPSSIQQTQFVQQAPSHNHQQQHVDMPSHGGQYNFVTCAGTSPGMQAGAQVPKQPAQQAAEFFVHEYSPPQDVKRAASPRKPPVDHGPKNYTFANHGPEHFEKEKAKREAKASGTDSSSPASSSS